MAQSNSTTAAGAGTGKLALQLKLAYWSALIVIGLMASASYLLLHQMMVGDIAEAVAGS